ncbi:MAG: PQQ-dependent sugar dehydrogenase [Achromobacter sp.]|uniref:PQQ-dependent sugar dehydrogenase n=1 Tax=Achromobacter sp. TaxID=134375 RepID=UPI003CFE9CD2
MQILRIAAAAGLALATLSACGEMARLPVEAGMGPSPQIPAPTPTLIPTVKTAKAVGWPAGAHPVAAGGMEVTAFAAGLDHPRWLYVLPNGDVLVAETNAPPKPESASGGLKAWVAGLAMKRAGARTASANRITLLRDADHDGVAETRHVLLDGLNSPFGMALIGNRLYVANADAVLRFPYEAGQTRIDSPGEKVTDLPAGINHHWTKNLLASPDGGKLYVSVGSNSNVAENGMEIEEGRAAIWEIDVSTGAKRLYATGLRNPVGMAWAPDGKTLWTAVNERDELGSDLVPDYMTSVRDGGFYGWPYSYFGQHVDTRVKPQRPDLVARAIVPDYALGPHTASLGLAWSDGAKLPEPFVHGMFVGQHGSWNRDPRSGYKVIFVPFGKEAPNGPARDVLTGFLNESGEAQGRPVGVAIDRQGGLLVADDVGNVVWRVGAAP